MDRVSSISAAQAGGDAAFARLIEPHRVELHAHCYRMLGSIHDADDALQDALVRAWRGLSRFEGRSSLRTWLYRIATNTCLDLIERRPKRVLPLAYGPAAAPKEGPGIPLAESVWLEPYPDDPLGLEDSGPSPDVRYEQRETVELAFVAALQHLPALQRAVLILRDVLEFSAQETAELLDTSVASVNSALQRARKRVDEKLPEQSQQETLHALGDARVAEIVQLYMDAHDRADVDALVALLADDVTWSMPPMATWYRGVPAVREFLADYVYAEQWRHLPARANGQAAVGCYTWDVASGAYVARVIDVLTLRDDRIADVTAFVDDRFFPRFGLPLVFPS